MRITYHTFVMLHRVVDGRGRGRRVLLLRLRRRRCGACILGGLVVETRGAPHALGTAQVEPRASPRVAAQAAGGAAGVVVGSADVVAVVRGGLLPRIASSAEVWKLRCVCCVRVESET